MGGASTRKQPKGHKNIPDKTPKRAGRDPKLYTDVLFLETSPKIKAELKPYFDSGYIQPYMTEMVKDVDRGIDFLQKCENYRYNGSSTLGIKSVCENCSCSTRCHFNTQQNCSHS